MLVIYSSQSVLWSAISNGLILLVLYELPFLEETWGKFITEWQYRTGVITYAVLLGLHYLRKWMIQPSNQMMESCREGSISGVQEALNSGCCPNKVDPAEDSMTALMVAIAARNMKIVELLVKNCRTDMRITDKFGRTAMHFACAMDNPWAVAMVAKKLQDLVDAGVEPVVDQMCDLGMSPLMWAIRMGNIDCFKELVGFSWVNLDMKDCLGQTLEEAARERNLTEIVRVLTDLKGRARSQLLYRQRMDKGKKAREEKWDKAYETAERGTLVFNPLLVKIQEEAKKILKKKREKAEKEKEQLQRTEGAAIEQERLQEVETERLARLVEENRAERKREQERREQAAKNVESQTILAKKKKVEERKREEDRKQKEREDREKRDQERKEQERRDEEIRKQEEMDEQKKIEEKKEEERIKAVQVAEEKRLMEIKEKERKGKELEEHLKKQKKQDKRQKKQTHLTVDVNGNDDQLIALRTTIENLKAQIEKEQEKIEEVTSSKAKEMGVLVQAISEAEDSKHAREKQMVRLDLEIKELESTVAKLVSEKRKLAAECGKEFEKIDKLDKKRVKLENVIDSEMNRFLSNDAKMKLEVEELEFKLDSLENEPAKETVSASSAMVNFVTQSIEGKEKDLECPVCLEVAMAPIYSCTESHVICSTCRPKVSRCPECRVAYRGPPRRHRFAERTAEELLGLRQQLVLLTG